MDTDFPEPEDPVEQEDGYISPGPRERSRGSTPDLSSPARPGATYNRRRSHPRHSSHEQDQDEERTPEEEEDDLFCGADILSSPAVDRSDVGRGYVAMPNMHRGMKVQKVVPLDFGVFSQGRTTSGSKHNANSEVGSKVGLDLRDAFKDDEDEVEEGEAPQCSFGSTASSGTPGPSTPIPVPTPSFTLVQSQGQASSSQGLVQRVDIGGSPSGLEGDWIDEDTDLDGELDGGVELSVLEDFKKRQDAVAQGWRKKFGYDGGASGGGGVKFATPAVSRTSCCFPFQAVFSFVGADYMCVAWALYRYSGPHPVDAKRQ